MAMARVLTAHELFRTNRSELMSSKNKRVEKSRSMKESNSCKKTIGGTPVLTAMHKFKVKSSARIKF
jgi:hypothetical protein